MQNAEQLENAYNTLKDSAGSAEKEQEAYMDSLSGRINALKESFTAITMQMVNSDFLKNFISNLTTGVNAVSGFIDTFGAMPTTVTAVVGALTIFNSKFRESISTMVSFTPGLSEIQNKLKIFESNLVKQSERFKANISTIKEYNNSTTQMGPPIANAGQSLLGLNAKLVATQGMLLATKIATVALNVALLTASNLWSYGKFLSGGFNTGRKASKIAKAIETVDGKKVLNEDAIRMKYLKAASVPPMEANEEMAQSAFDEITGLKYASELNSFYGAKLDPDAEEQTIDWMEAISQGLGNTYGNAAGWEEGFLGGLMGGMGMPHISMRKNESGKRRPKLTLEGELYDNIREAKALKKEALGALEATNNRLKSSDFLNYYQGHIRHTKYQNDMEEALAKGDNFSYKNAESSQFVSDAIMFDKAGRIQDLYDTIEEAGNVTLEDVGDIRKQTTKKDGETSIYDSMSDQEVVDHIRKQATEAKQKLDKYVEISNNLKTLYGEDISSDTLEELTWAMTQIDDWEKRTKSIMNDIRTVVEGKAKVINDRFGIDISTELGNLEVMLNQVGATDDSNIIDQINRIINDKNISIKEGRQRIEELIKAKEIERSDSGLKLGREIQHIRKKARERREALIEEERALEEERERDSATNESLFSQIVALKEMLEADDYKIIDPLNTAKLIENIQDLIKLYVARASFINTYTTLSEHPELFTEKAQAEIEHIKSLIQEKEVNTSLDNLGDIESVSKLRKVLNTIDDNIVDEVLKKYSERGEKEKSLVDEFDRVNDYGKSLVEALGTIPQEEGDLAASLYALLQSAFEVADSVDDLKSTLEEAKSHIPDNVAKALDKIVGIASKNLKSKKAAGKKDTNKPKQEPKKAGFSVSDSLSDNEEEAAKGQREVEGTYNRTKPKKKANPKDDSEEGSPEVSDLENKSTEELEEITKGKVPSNIPDKDKPKVEKLAATILKNRKIPDGDSQAEGTNAEDNNPKKEQESVGVHLRSWYHTKYRFDELKDRTIRRAERYDSPVVDALDELGAFDFVDKGYLGILFQNNPKIPIHYVKVKDKRLKDVIVLAVEVTPEVTQIVNPTTSFIAQDGKRYQAVGALGFNKEEAAINAYNLIKGAVESSYNSFKVPSSKDTVSHSYLGTGGRENTVLVEKTPIPLDLLNEGDEFFGPNNTPMTLIQKLGNDEYIVVKKGESTQYIIGPTANSQEWIRSKPKVYRTAKGNQAATSTPDYYVYPDATNEIQHIYSGRMVKATNHDAPRQKPLKELTSNPILGVYYGNSPIPRVPMLNSEEEVVPLNSNNANPRDGSVWLMSREADGRWYAKAVQVKRFTADEYDIDEHYDTPIMQAIVQDLRIIADPNKTDYDRAIAKYDLMNILYFPEGVNILFHRDSVSIQGFKNNIGEELSIDEKIQALLEALQDESLNLRFQVDPNSLSERVYVKDLLDSDILTTDLAMVHNINASFDLKIPDAQGNLKEEKIHPTGHTGRKGINNTIASVTVMVNGTKYSMNEEGIVTDSEGNTITDQNSLDEIAAVMDIKEGRINPVEGNNRLYLSVYSSTGEQFGVSGNHIITGEKLEEMLQRARKKEEEKDKKQNLDKAFGAMEQASDDEFAEMGYDIGGTPKSQSKPKSILGDLITDKEEESVTAFNVGDKVHYNTKNKEGNGEIVRISSNGKSFEVLEDGGRKVWYAASLLTKLEEPDADEGLFDEPVDTDKESTSEGIFAGREFHKPDESEPQSEEKEKPVKHKPKGPVSIGEIFNKESTLSIKELKKSKSNPDFKRLARVNRRYLTELGFNSIQELEDFINDPKNKMPAIETIDSQDKFINMLDIIAECRGK